MNRKVLILIFAAMFLLTGILGTQLITPVEAQLAVDPYTSALWHFDWGTGNIECMHAGVRHNQ